MVNSFILEVTGVLHSRPAFVCFKTRGSMLWPPSTHGHREAAQKLSEAKGCFFLLFNYFFFAESSR